MKEGTPTKASNKVWQQAASAVQSQKASRLKSITFLHGDQELQDFPDYLREALEENLRKTKSKHPTCLRGKCGENINSSKGREAFFIAANSNERLLQARFKYGSDKQITVVKDTTGHTISKGRAIIVVGKPGGSVPYSRPDGKPTHSRIDYQIWASSHHYKSFTAKTHVIRLIKLDKSPQQQGSASIKSELPQVGKTDLVNNDAYESGSDTPLIKQRFWSSQTLLPSSQHTSRSEATLPSVSQTSTWDTRQTASQTVSRTSAIQQQFVFKATKESATLRTKPFSMCDSVQKLFAQAKAAGIITKDSVVLRVITLGSSHPVMLDLIRGDTDDFDDFIALVKQERERISEVLILPGDE